MTTAVVATIEVLSSAGEILRDAPIRADRFAIGRDGAVDLACPDDERMGGDHAHIVARAGGFEIEDRDDPRGIWLRVRGPEGRMLGEGDQLWLGGQLLQVARAEAAWTLRHHGPDGRFREAHEVPEGGLFIGREADLVLDASDAQLSRRHAQVVHDGGALRFYDRGAHNGSFVRVVGRERLEDGMEFRAGSSRFRFVVSTGGAAQPEAVSEPDDSAEATDALGSHAPVDETTEALGPRAPESEASTAGDSEGHAEGRAEAEADGGDGPEPAAVGLAVRLKQLARGAEPVRMPDPEPEAPAAARSRDDSRSQASGTDSAEAVVVVLEADDETMSLEGVSGQTVLEIAQAAALERGRFLDWECGDGGCGVCVLAIAEGADGLDPPDPETGEMKTIQITEQVAPDPNRYRLACLAKVRGPVRLRKMT